MNSILESGNLIKRIKNGENLPEIAHYALECLYQDGPIDTVVLEIISYLKIFQPDFFTTIENDVIEIMGLFFKLPKPETLQGVVFDIYSQLVKEKWGDNYTPMQADILKQINSKQCFSFSAPTSTGKSFVFRNLITKSQKDIVVVVPSRALINEYHDKVCNAVDVKEVNVLTFVDRINTKHAKRNVFILTPERARELFKNKSWLDIEYILFDEAQLSDEKSTRGIYFDSIVRRALKVFPNARFIFAHPFISNPQAQLKKNDIELDESSFSRQYKQKNVGQIFYTHNPDTEEFHHFGTNKKIFGEQKILSAYDPIEHSLKNGGSVLVYAAKAQILEKKIFQRFSKYFDLCPEITDPEALELIEKLREYIGASKNDVDYYNSDMIDNLMHGIVSHHGSIPLTARLILEHFTQKGFCKLCFATSTLEQGINMPFDVVYIDRFEASKSLSVKNLIGRAGRSTTSKSFDIGGVIVRTSAMTPLRKTLLKSDPISEVSHLDIKDDKIDDTYQEFKDAIKNGTFNDEYNLTDKDVEKIKADEIKMLVPTLLDMVFIGENIVTAEEITQEIKEVFHKLYESYLGRPLVISEKNVLNEAIKIMLWKVTGRTFRNICQIRYARVAQVNERRKHPERVSNIPAKYMVGYNEIPNKNLPNYPKIPSTTLAKNVDYDTIVFDTYDFLDKMIGFKLSDIYYAIFNEYYLDTGDERARKMANYMKFGTTDGKEIWMLRYGFSFEDIEWLKPHVKAIDEEEICFYNTVSELDDEKSAIIEKFMY